MNNCKKCNATTNYYMGDIPLCFTCICEIEKNTEAMGVISRCEIITGVSYSMMRRKTRKMEVVQARRYTMKILRDEKVGNLSLIGDLFNMDYSSVSIGIKIINELIDTKQVKYETRI